MVSGVVNRGDSFRRRRSRSNSLAPPGLLPQEIPNLPTVPAPPQDVTTYRVALIGAQGVGRTALISQFMSSECINAYDRSHCEYFFSNLTFPPPLHSFFPPSTPPLPSLSPHIPSLPLVSAELKKKKKNKNSEITIANWKSKTFVFSGEKNSSASLDPNVFGKTMAALNP